jgi:hypothetical protein
LVLTIAGDRVYSGTRDLTSPLRTNLFDASADLGAPGFVEPGPLALGWYVSVRPRFVITASYPRAMASPRVSGCIVLACFAWLFGCDSAAKREPTPTKPATAKSPAKDPAPIDSPAPSTAAGCDGAGLDALAASLTSASAPERPQLAVRSLVERCDGQLPGRIRWMLRTLLPEHTSELMKTVKADDAEIAIWDAACPGQATVMAEAMSTPSSERAGFIYESCDFARFELMTKSDLATRSFSGLPPWVAHHWLIERGASKASAQVISMAVFDQIDAINAGL